MGTPAALGHQARLDQAQGAADKAAGLLATERRKRDRDVEIAKVAERLRYENGLSAMVWDILTGNNSGG